MTLSWPHVRRPARDHGRCSTPTTFTPSSGLYPPASAWRPQRPPSPRSNVRAWFFVRFRPACLRSRPCSSGGVTMILPPWRTSLPVSRRFHVERHVARNGREQKLTAGLRHPAHNTIKSRSPRRELWAARAANPAAGNFDIISETHYTRRRWVRHQLHDPAQPVTRLACLREDFFGGSVGNEGARQLRKLKHHVTLARF